MSKPDTIVRPRSRPSGFPPSPGEGQGVLAASSIETKRRSPTSGTTPHPWPFPTGREEARRPAQGRGPDIENAGTESTAALRDRRFRALLPREDWAALPQAVRDRFSKRLGPGDTAVYVGRTVEMRASLVGRLVAQLARLIGGPLPLVMAVGTASVVGLTEDAASGGQVWTRLYASRRGFPQIVHSAKRFAGPTGLEEYVGCGIGMALDVAVEGRALVFRSRHFFLQTGGRRLRLPAWLCPGRVRVAHEDLGRGAFRFTLEVDRLGVGLAIRQVGVYQDR